MTDKLIVINNIYNSYTIIKKTCRKNGHVGKAFKQEHNLWVPMLGCYRSH